MFDYNLVAPKEGDYPFTPSIHIVLNNVSTDSDGRVSLSAQLMTDHEIDYRIQSIKDDLDRIGHTAKQALRRAHARPNRVVPT